MLMRARCINYASGLLTLVHCLAFNSMQLTHSQEVSIQASGILLLMSHLCLDFELGLELDSAEVQGVLLNNGYECGRAMFDFIV